MSREDTTELTEVEDVKHFGDFSDAVSAAFYDFSCGIRVYDDGDPIIKKYLRKR